MKAIKILMKVVLIIVFMYVISAQINMICIHCQKFGWGSNVAFYTHLFVVIICILMGVYIWTRRHVFIWQFMKLLCYVCIFISLRMQFILAIWTWFNKSEDNHVSSIFWVYDLPLLLSLFILIFAGYFVYRLPVKKKDT
ncbi:hypothetical protein [Butyricimonas synergistica]|uniref:hypothetical protein n=1 Tax=Butyricimonas synergistica TaxID=544644 RepID=UPI000379984A|nr:hypothetical protein [Butyricimonas synergistica]